MGHHILGRRIARGVLPLVAVGSLLAPAQFARDTEFLTPQGQTAFEQISQCVATNHILLATLLVDDTGTLNTMDPELARRGAVMEVLAALAELGRQPTAEGEAITVKANLGLFDGQYREIAGWGDLNGAHLTELQQIAETSIQNPAPGLQTNFATALSGAQASLNAQAAEVGTQTCSIIFWFTDGKPDVGPGNVAATEASVTDICAAGGIADSIRQRGTHLIALALFTDISGRDDIPLAHQVTDADRHWLQSVAEASGPGGVTCGTAEGALGAYLMAADGAQLHRQFAGAGAMVQGATPGGTGLSNFGGPITIPVDDAVGRVRLAFSVAEGDMVPVQFPDGSILNLTPGTQSTGGVTADVRGSGGSFVATISATDGLPIGLWSIPPAGTALPVVVTDVFYFWDAGLSISAPAGLTIGEQNQIVISRVRDGAGDPDGFAASDWYAQAPLVVTVDGVTVPEQIITDHGDGTYTFDLNLTGQETTTQTQIVATQRAITQGHSLNLGPISAVANIPVSLPAGFPAMVGDAALDFGTFTFGESPVRSLGFQGSDQGDSSVCFGNANWASAPADSQLQITVAGLDADNCLVLGTNETRTVEVSLGSGSAADGNIAGSLPITLNAVRDAAPQSMTVPVVASMFRL